MKRFAKALGASISDILPEDGNVDSVPVLREKAKELFEAIIKSEDCDVLLALNPMLACLVESVKRRA